MRFHNRSLFKDAYRPRGFCYAVRPGPRRDAAGFVSIEAARCLLATALTNRWGLYSLDIESSDLQAPFPLVHYRRHPAEAGRRSRRRRGAGASACGGRSGGGADRC